MRADPPHVLIVGAGFADLRCARALERLLGPGPNPGTCTAISGSSSTSAAPGPSPDPWGRNLHGLPAQIVTRGYHLSALPSLRSRTKAATDGLVHGFLGDDFVRTGLRGAKDRTLGAVGATDGHSGSARGGTTVVRRARRYYRLDIGLPLLPLRSHTAEEGDRGLGGNLLFEAANPCNAGAGQGSTEGGAVHSEATDKERRAQALQDQLRDLLCLAVVGDHLRWVLRGDRTEALASWLRTGTDRWRRGADVVATQMRELEAAPDARVRALARDIPFNWVPEGWMSGSDARRLMADRLKRVVAWTAARASAAAAGNDQNLFRQLADDLGDQSKALADIDA